MPSCITILYNHFNHYQHLFLHQKQMSKSADSTCKCKIRQ